MCPLLVHRLRQQILFADPVGSFRKVDLRGRTTPVAQLLRAVPESDFGDILKGINRASR